MRTLDHQVLDVPAFLDAVLRGCPRGSVLEVETDCRELQDLLEPLALPRIGLRRLLRPTSFLLPDTGRAEIASAIASCARSQELSEVALRCPDVEHTWFEAFHFVEPVPTVFLHDKFPEALLANLRERAVLQLDPSELPDSIGPG